MFLKKIDQFKGRYFFLSNFYEANVCYDGLLYFNNEAAFQSAKTLDIEKRKDFMSLPPNKAKAKGRSIKLRSDWEKVKDQVMYDVVKDKFERNEYLKEKLLKTEDAILIEGNTWNDTYWGVCKKQGKNILGKILMRVREELKNEY